MQAYIDDSKGPPVFVLAGFIARTDQWSALTARWHDALDLPPRLKYFKMHEAHTCTGEFTGWKQTDRDVRLASLAGIIKDHVVAGVSSVVRQDDYDEIMAGRIAKPLDYPYWLMYYSIIMRTLLLHRENGLVEKTDFIFDEQPDQSRQVQEHFNAVYDLAPPRSKNFSGILRSIVMTRLHCRFKQLTCLHGIFTVPATNGSGGLSLIAPQCRYSAP
jgi:hypothetical protein